jgi:glutamate dehydrogenase
MDLSTINDRWSALARSAFKSDLDWAQRELTISVLNLEVDAKTTAARVNVWLDKYARLVERWKRVLADVRASSTKDFAILSVAVRELMDFATTSSQIKK